MSVEIPPRAQVDIDLASEEIGARYGESTALRFQDRLTRLLAKLDALPELAGAVDPPFPKYPGLRVAQVPRFSYQLVYYELAPTGIRVVRVIHASRDAGVIFG
jgi:plasmid stabilization system protein ParE